METDVTWTAQPPRIVVFDLCPLFREALAGALMQAGAFSVTATEPKAVTHAIVEDGGVGTFGTHQESSSAVPLRDDDDGWFSAGTDGRHPDAG